MPSGVALTDSEIDARIEKASAGTIKRVGRFSGVLKPCKVECTICNRQWQARPHDIHNGHLCQNGCQSGVNNRKWTDQEFRARVKQLHPQIKLLTPYHSMLRSVEAKCLEHRLEFATPARNFIRGTGCPECAKIATAFKADGKTVLLRGREPQALSWILKSTRFRMSDIVVQPPYFRYKFKGKARRYHPDFLVDNRIVVEVKSRETAGLGSHFYYNGESLFDLLKAKAEAVRRHGYEFRLLVMESDGRKLTLPKNWHKLTKEAVQTYMTS